MKTIILKKLTLQDWRGQNKVINFGHNTEIKGRNKSGKSSCFNAWLWLLTGADEQDRINYKLFDDTLPLTYENSKLASAEAVLDIDGVEYTLKKTAKQGWTRKKGREEYEKKATDDYKFYIDSIERSAGDYKSFIEETFAPFDKLKLMLNIRHYESLDWKDMRKHFESLVGNIDESEMKGDYTDILNDLRKYPIDEVKTSYKSKIKAVKSSVESLPITIQTLQTSLPDIQGLDNVKKEIEETKKQIADIDAQITGSSESVQQYIDKRNAELKEISELESQLAEAESKYNLKPIEEANKIKAEMAEIDIRNAQILKENESSKQSIENAEKTLKSATSKLEKLNEYRNTLLKQNEEVKAMVFTDDKCAYCGQTLPEDKLEEAKKQFFERKEAKHNAIVAEGKANNEKIAGVKKEIDEAMAVIEKGYAEKPLLDKTELENILADLRKNFIPYKETIEGKEKVSEISNKKANMTVVPTQDNAALINMKKDLINDVEELSKKLGVKDTYDKQIEVIKYKQNEFRESSIELARLEGMLNKAIKYEQEKAQLVSDKVNGMFDYISVVMTSVNKSGDIVPDCRILDNEGVSAQVTNAASRVRCGLDLSLGFQKFYGLNLPIFIDESHTVDEDNYPLIENQTIKMWNNGGEFSVEIKD